ncbi:hypothetical protein OA107_00640 [Candidatus Pelagibacter sp.]|nr:hypothetical protein [Candidatus Pelagibacter sp.]
MLKFIIPAICIFLIVLFWEKISEKIYQKFKIKSNNVVLIIVVTIFVAILALLYF